MGNFEFITVKTLSLLGFGGATEIFGGGLSPAARAWRRHWLQCLCMLLWHLGYTTVMSSSSEFHSVTNKLQWVLNAAARAISCTRKFDRDLTQLPHASLHWLHVPEWACRVQTLTMHWCQDGTAAQYLAVHWALVSWDCIMTASLFGCQPSTDIFIISPGHIWWSFTVSGRSMWNLNVKITLPTALLSLADYWKHLFSE